MLRWGGYFFDAKGMCHGAWNRYREGRGHLSSFRKWLLLEEESNRPEFPLSSLWNACQWQTFQKDQSGHTR